MGYLPPGDDVRRLHHLESRFASLMRRLMATYPGERVPLAACQEAVARWFGHPHWHAVIARKTRTLAKGPAGWASAAPMEDGTPATWSTDVPLKTLKSLANTLHHEINNDHEKDRETVLAMSDGRAFDLMARTMGFRTSLDLNQAWAARQLDLKPRSSWIARVVGLLCPTPPNGPWAWARHEHDMAHSLSMPEHGTSNGAPMVRALGQDLDSGWWMGMNDDQVRQHTLLLGQADVGRDVVLAGWVVQAMRENQGVVWLCGNAPKRARDIEQRFNQQAKLCWRDQDRVTLNLSGQPDLPGSRPLRVNLLDTVSATTLTEMLVNVVADDENETTMWMGRTISLVSVVCMALVWERNQKGTVLSLARLRDAFELTTLQRMVHQDNPSQPPQIGVGLLSYLRSLPGYQNGPVETMKEIGHEFHAVVKSMITRILDKLVPFEDRLFNNDSLRENWQDVTQGNRLLLVQVGERSSTSVLLERLVIGALRFSLSQQLGLALGQDENDVDFAHVVERRSAPRSTWIFDNVPLSVMRGASVMPSQMRGLGIGAVCAYDRLDDAKAWSRSPEEFNVVLANINTKVVMRHANVAPLSNLLDACRPSHGAALAHDHESKSKTESSAMGVIENDRRINPSAVSHYAIGEALVIHKDERWHVGLLSNLTSLH